MVLIQSWFTDLEVSYFFVNLGVYAANENSCWYFYYVKVIVIGCYQKCSLCGILMSMFTRNEDEYVEVQALQKNVW